jgi:hypothetical protein
VLSILDTASLESSLSALNVALDWAITAIVVGLILEYAPEFWSKLSRKAPKRWIEKTGEILVILGVAGELLLHIRSEQIEDQIKSQQRAELSKQAADIKMLHAGTDLAFKQLDEAATELRKLTLPRTILIPPVSLITFARKYPEKTFWIIVEKNEQDSGSEQEQLGARISSELEGGGWKKDDHWSKLDPLKVDPPNTPVSNRGCAIETSDEMQSAFVGRMLAAELSNVGVRCRHSEGSEIKNGHVIFEIGLR